MQAILTKWFGPSNVQGSRIKATCDAKSITRSCDDALTVEANQIAVANELADLLGWRFTGARMGEQTYKLVSGTLPGLKSSMAHVLVRVEENVSSPITERYAPKQERVTLKGTK